MGAAPAADTGEPADGDGSLVHHPGRVAGVGAALLGVGLVLLVVISLDPAHPAVQPLDDRWYDAMVGVRTDPLVALGRALAFVGSAVVMTPLRLVAAGVLAWQRRWAAFTAFAGTMITAELFIGPVKGLLDRPRPLDRLVEVTNASYPSGHTISAASTAVGLVIAFVPPGRARRGWFVLAAAWTLLMAWSRTYVAAHWFTDVVGGACLGAGVALLWPAAVQHWRRLPAGSPTPIEEAV